jgi:hypothetical protein
LFDSFAKEFFTKRQFMVEHVSLQALVAIARHPTLSPYLNEVIISAQTLSFSNGQDWDWDSTFVPRQVLLDSGIARDMLVDAFSKLPNLRTVGLRDYDGLGRVRDGAEARWRSYGWSFGRDTSTSHGGERHLHVASAATILPLLLRALGIAGSRPRSLEVFLRRRELLMPFSFQIIDR